MFVVYFIVYVIHGADGIFYVNFFVLLIRGVFRVIDALDFFGNTIFLVGFYIHVVWVRRFIWFFFFGCIVVV